MLPSDFISTKTAAIQAEVHSGAIFVAIRRGRIHVVRRKGRVFVDRLSFEAWLKRLQARRAISVEEKNLPAWPLQKEEQHSLGNE